MHRWTRYSWLFGLNLFLGLTAVGGGLSLLAGWIRVPPGSLAGSPFTDYSVPAILLAAVIGSSALLAAWAARIRAIRLAVPLSATAGGAIIIFEIVEWSIIGFALLQAVYIGIGVAIVSVAAWIQMANLLGSVTRPAPPRAVS